MELEVVMRDQQSDAEGQEIVEGLMASLGVERTDLLERAYMDLLEKNA
jgi:adenylate cyclase class IV